MSIDKIATTDELGVIKVGENLTITEKTFKLPKKFEFSNKCGNGRFGTFISENTDKYKIEFYDFSRPMVKSSIWADDQVLEDDDKRNCTTITFTSTQTVKVEEWVLSQGMYAKPLEPEWLVNAWKAHIKNMCKNELVNPNSPLSIKEIKLIITILASFLHPDFSSSLGFGSGSVEELADFKVPVRIS